MKTSIDIRQGSVAGIHYELHRERANGTASADRPVLFLGFPIMASHAQVFGDAAGAVRGAFLEPLLSRFDVLLADYPNIGRSTAPPADEMTIGRVCGDMLSVADAAGVARFAWWGGTFGAIVGLHLAERTDRLSALVCAGWPPLGAPYGKMLSGARAGLADPPPHARVILRSPAQYAQWVTFYESLQDWREEEALRKMKCPRLVIYGENAQSSVAHLPLPLAAIIRERRSKLAGLGWQVVEVPGADSTLILEPSVLMPVVRPWLERATHPDSIRPNTLQQSRGI